MSRGDDKRCIFSDAADYRHFLELLAKALTRFSVRCHAFCLLWNHFHLLLRPGPIPLSRMMQQLNSDYCQWFNRQHQRVGHLLQGRYKGPLVDNAGYFLNAVRYIVLNPVEARQVQHPADWAWSSYRATAGLAPPPKFLDLDEVWKALDASAPDEGPARFETFCSAGIGSDDPWATLIRGSERLKRRVDPLLVDVREKVDFVYKERFATRPPLADILKTASNRDSRDLAVREAFCVHAYTLREIGEAVGSPVGTIWSWVQRAERLQLRGQISIIDVAQISDHIEN